MFFFVRILSYVILAYKFRTSNVLCRFFGCHSTVIALYYHCIVRLWDCQQYNYIFWSHSASKIIGSDCRTKRIRVWYADFIFWNVRTYHTSGTRVWFSVLELWSARSKWPARRASALAGALASILNDYFYINFINSADTHINLCTTKKVAFYIQAYPVVILFSHAQRAWREGSVRP